MQETCYRVFGVPTMGPCMRGVSADAPSGKTDGTIQEGGQNQVETS